MTRKEFHHTNTTSQRRASEKLNHPKMFDKTSQEATTASMNEFTWAVIEKHAETARIHFTTNAQAQSEATRIVQEASKLVSPHTTSTESARQIREAEQAVQKATLDELAWGPWADQDDEKRAAMLTSRAGTEGNQQDF